MKMQRVCGRFKGTTAYWSDLGKDGRPIGIEILAPHEASLMSINEILAKYALPSLKREEVAPLAVVGKVSLPRDLVDYPMQPILVDGTFSFSRIE